LRVSKIKILQPKIQGKEDGKMNPVEETSEKLKTLPSDRLMAVSGLIEGWLDLHPERSVPVSSVMAQTVVNDWLLQVLPDRFTATEPKLIAGGDIWCVPVGLAYPNIGVVGQVGEVLVSAFSAGIISATSPEPMKLAAMKCYAERESEINSAFLSAGDS
jgi:hypothetical protein